jgi:hypothetical protein
VRPIVLMNGLRVSLGVFAVGLLWGCRDDPRAVLGDARQALKNRDEAAFLALLEPRSRALLEDAARVGKRSGQTWKVLNDSLISAGLLPKGEVVGEPVDNGQQAVVMVNQGSVTRRVPLRLVQGQWRIDLLETDTFWAMARPLEAAP